MGIRIHKFLGYGLTDVQCAKNGHVTDPRINPEALSRAYDVQVADYRKWLDEQPDDERGFPYATLERWFFRDQPWPRHRDLSDCVRHDSEFGIPDVLAIQPLACKDWHRYDDMIDWVEETYLPRGDHEPQRSWVEVLPHGIYPWSGSYMDRRSGVKLDDRVMNWVRHHSHMREAGASPLDRQILDAYAGELGFESDEAAQRYIRPIVPQEVQAVCKFLGLFTDDDTWLELRPLVYVWWS